MHSVYLNSQDQQSAEPTSTGSASQRAVAFLRCCSCRFTALYYVPFVAGLVQSGRASLAYALLGAIFWTLHSLGIEVTNRLADRTEDEINRPERTALCEVVGWETLASAQHAIWGSVLIIDVCWLSFAGNPLFACLLGASLCLGVAYSRGPRLSRNRYFAFFTLNMLFGGAFLLGWSAGDPFGRAHTHGWTQLQAFMPLLLGVGLFILTFAGIKDITDREGDLRIGYSSPFVELIEQHSIAALLGFAALPFASILACVLTGVLPMRMVALLAFVPVSLTLAAGVFRARDRLDQMLVREAFYNYWLSFSSAAVLLFLPRTALALAVLAACAYWLLTTRRLHWGDALNFSSVRRIVAVARRVDDASVVSSFPGSS